MPTLRSRRIVAVLASDSIRQPCPPMLQRLQCFDRRRCLRVSSGGDDRVGSTVKWPCLCLWVEPWRVDHHPSSSPSCWGGGDRATLLLMPQGDGTGSLLDRRPTKAEPLLCMTAVLPGNRDGLADVVAVVVIAAAAVLVDRLRAVVPFRVAADTE